MDDLKPILTQREKLVELQKYFEKKKDSCNEGIIDENIVFRTAAVQQMIMYNELNKIVEIILQQN